MWSRHSPPIRTPGTLGLWMETVLLFLGFPQWHCLLSLQFSWFLSQLSLEVVLTSPLPLDKDIIFFLIWESKAVHILWGLGDQRGEVLMFASRSVSCLGSPRGSWSRYLSLPSLQSPPHLYLPPHKVSWLLCSLPRDWQQAKYNASHLCRIVSKRWGLTEEENYSVLFTRSFSSPFLSGTGDCPGAQTLTPIYRMGWVPPQPSWQPSIVKYCSSWPDWPQGPGKEYEGWQRQLEPVELQQLMSQCFLKGFALVILCSNSFSRTYEWTLDFRAKFLCLDSPLQAAHTVVKSL